MAYASASERRRAPRIIPAQPVKFAMETESNPLTYGIVADISEGGACVCTNVALGVGEDVLFRLNTNHHQQVPAAGRVVWKEGNGTGVRRYGIQWTHSGPPRLRLNLLIGTLS